MKTLAIFSLAFAVLLPAVAVAADPVLTVTEPGLGTWQCEGPAMTPVVLAVAASTDLAFSWLGDASGYGGIILGYRYGWDLVDPDNPTDPGWATPGYVPGLLAAPTIAFAAGEHSLHIVVADMAGGLTRAWFQVQVSPPTAAENTSWGQLKAAFRR